MAWVVSWGDEGSSWWEVNRVPTFIKIGIINNE